MAITQDISNILIIDDIPANRKLIRKVLEDENYHLYEAENGQTALEKMAELTPDLIISDINMPRMNGFEFTERVKSDSNTQHIPIILVTALSDDDSRIRGLNLGAEDFLSKPINLTETQTKVRNLLRLKKAIDELEKRNVALSTIDQTTQLANFQSAQQFLSQHAEQKKTQTLVLAAVGFRNFDLLLSGLDPDQGKQLLRGLGERFAGSFEPDTHIFYLSNGRFLLARENKQIEQQVHAFNHALEKAFSQPIDVPPFNIRVHAKIGISCFPDNSRNIGSLLHQVTASLEQALNSSQTVHYYKKHILDNAKQKIHIINDLHRALKNGEFHLCYQPKLSLHNQNIESVEALIRWQNPLLGLVSPLDFIPIAEDSGMIWEIGQWVLHECVDMYQRWHANNEHALRIAANVSPQQFGSMDFLAVINDVLKRGIPPQDLELELTESTAMADVEYSKLLLQQLSNKGLRLAIDDFGTGYSSLSYLSQFPIHYLKIDRSLIMNIPSNKQSNILAQSIIDLAHNLNIDIIAEGVETEAQLKFLQKQNCNHIQGYYISKPLLENELQDFIAHYNRKAS